MFYNITEKKIKSLKIGEAADVIAPLWDSVNIYKTYEIYKKALAEFSAEQAYIFAIHWYCAEVLNGGHHQFFYNSTGIVWKDALEGFYSIGAKEIAENFENVIALFKDKPSFDREERYKQLDIFDEDTSLWDKLEEYDSIFYNLESDDNLYQPIVDYIKAHADKFTFIGYIEKDSGYNDNTRINKTNLDIEALDMEEILKLVDENYKEDADSLNVNILEPVKDRLDNYGLSLLARTYNNNYKFNNAIEIYSNLIADGYKMQAIDYYRLAHAEFYSTMDAVSLTHINKALEMEASEQEKKWFRELKKKIEDMLR